MKLVRGAWKILVGIKDALVLLLLLLFFGALFAALSASPNRNATREGALLVDLDGSLVEQPERPSSLASLGGAGRVASEHRLRDVVRAIRAAKDDARVKAVVVDLDRFTGGYPAGLSEVAGALAEVRQSGKPVLAYATAYTDSGYLIASAASEIWTHPMGGTLLRGPGGSTLYYKGLLDKLGVTAHVYRVGEFKSAVEPYIRADQSPAAREMNQALYGGLFAQWQGLVHRFRPKAQIAQLLAQPDAAVTAAGGDLAQANLATGLIDKVGDRIAFGKRVAQLAGADTRKGKPGFRAIALDDWVEAHPLPRGGDAIGVVTVAGDIVDGSAGPGSAGGDTIARLITDGLAKGNLKALVVRVDSPGGSAIASEQIRLAVMEAKAKGLPVVVSMGGLAASGGYWVSTAGDLIYAEPNTVTGSIGIFGLIPTFEKTLAKAGITADGVRTTPLSGQPDVMTGTNPVFDRVLQANIESGYRRFTTLVAKARHLPVARVDQIGQGRVWIGGTAHQLGLVDRFGTLDDAVAEAARRAKLDPAKVHAEYLEKAPSTWETLLASLAKSGDDDDAQALDTFGQLSAERRAVFAQALGDARRLTSVTSVQARCLECAGLGPMQAAPGDARLVDLLLAHLLP